MLTCCACCAVLRHPRRRYHGGVHMKRYTQLRHADRGAVSISLGGDEFLIALTRCLHRDDTHQVRSPLFVWVGVYICVGRRGGLVGC